MEQMTVHIIDHDEDATKKRVKWNQNGTTTFRTVGKLNGQGGKIKQRKKHEENPLLMDHGWREGGTTGERNYGKGPRWFVPGG